MTDVEIRRALRAKYADAPSSSPRYKRKAKLKMRYAGRYESELARAEEKVAMLRELIREQR